MKRLRIYSCLLALCIIGFYGVSVAQDKSDQLPVSYIPAERLVIDANINIPHDLFCEESNIDVLGVSQKEVISESKPLATNQDMGSKDTDQSCHNCHISQSYVLHKTLEVPWQPGPFLV